MVLSAGFVDIQINGAFGVDFSDPNLTADDVLKVRRGLVQHGVTSFCPTIVSSSKELYRKVVEKLAPVPGSVADGAGILGLHLEGPFICKSKKGAHDETVLRTPCDGGESLQDMYGDLATTKIVTLAPELPGALDAIEYLASRRIVASMGHSSASAADADAGVERGATLLTHLFNVRVWQTNFGWVVPCCFACVVTASFHCACLLSWAARPWGLSTTATQG